MPSRWVGSSLMTLSLACLWNATEFAQCSLLWKAVSSVKRGCLIRVGCSWLVPIYPGQTIVEISARVVWRGYRTSACGHRWLRLQNFSWRAAETPSRVCCSSPAWHKRGFIFLVLTPLATTRRYRCCSGMSGFSCTSPGERGLGCDTRRVIQQEASCSWPQVMR